MENINLKAARKFIKDEIALLAETLKTDKKDFRKAQSCVSTIFLQNKLNPYGWAWIMPNGQRCYGTGSANYIPEKSYLETIENYEKRCFSWDVYINTSPWKFLPYYSYITDEEKITINCLHVLYNRLRNNKQHTKNDKIYETHPIYKGLVEKLEVQFPLLPVANEVISGEAHGMG